jgi:hypothetical protein
MTNKEDRLDEKLEEVLVGRMVSSEFKVAVEEIKQAFIEEGWSKPPKATGKADSERILAVKRAADINDIRLLAISTPLYDSNEFTVTKLGKSYGIDHVIGMVHLPMYYKLLDAKRASGIKE